MGLTKAEESLEYNVFICRGIAMLSVRLQGDLESQLEFLSATSGLSKNQLVTAAIEQFLKLHDLGKMPVDGQIREADVNPLLHARRYQDERSKDAVAVAEMAQGNSIFSAVPDVSGKVTGAIYGRNIVVGYSWSQDDEVMVVSKNQGPNPALGADAYRLDVTSFDTWKNHMRRYESLK